MRSCGILGPAAIREAHHFSSIRAEWLESRFTGCATATRNAGHELGDFLGISLGLYGVHVTTLPLDAKRNDLRLRSWRRASVTSRRGREIRSQLAELPTDQIREVVVGQVNDLSPSDRQDIVAEQVRALPEKQLQEVVREQVKELSPERRQEVVAEQVKDLSEEGRREVCQIAGIGPPPERIAGILWVMVVGAFVLLLLGSALATYRLIQAGKETEVVVPFVTAAIGVLAGLLAPTPGTRR